MTIDISVFRTEDLDEAQRDAIIDTCIAAHDEEEFRNLFKVFIPSGGRHVVAHRGSVVVCHAVATTRFLQAEDNPIWTTAYIDAVSTLPSEQGRGHGSAVMRRLAAEIQDFEIACLQTDREGFYEQLGWECWRGPLAGRSDDGLIPTPDQRGVMVLRLTRTPQLDLDTLLTIEPQPSRIWE